MEEDFNQRHFPHSIKQQGAPTPATRAPNSFHLHRAASRGNPEPSRKSGKRESDGGPGQRQETKTFGLTCIGDGEAVGRLYVVHVRDEVKGRFRGVGAGVVEEDRQSERRVLLIGIPNEQPTWTGGGE